MSLCTLDVLISSVSYDNLYISFIWEAQELTVPFKPYSNPCK